MTQLSQHISVPKRFFVKEREHVYSDWPTANWRENFQNSIDARARNINITTEGEGGIGGFGRARILACFSMKSYEFRTQYCLCRGDGSMYDIETVPDYHHGCRFRFNIGRAATESQILSALYSVLERSQLDCKVFINGVQFLDWMRKQRHVRDESFGAIHLNKSRYSDGTVTVRVKGLWTFSVPTSYDRQVVVEIDPKRARDILTVNRDGMHYGHQAELQRFLETLAIDKLSALKEKRRKTRLIEGTGVHVSCHTPEQIAKFTESKEVCEAQLVSKAPSSPIGGGVVAAVAVSSAMASLVEREIVSGDQFQMMLPTIYLNDATDVTDPEHRKVRRVIEQYDPTNWTFFTKKRSSSDSGTETFRRGGTKLKLLMIWEVCCREAVRSLMNEGILNEFSWMTGWTFDLEHGACHEELSQGHALCLNPVSDDGRMMYKIRNRKDQKKLMALAKHEVAHVRVQYHDESFASVMTNIDMCFDEAACYRAIREALKAA